MWFSFLENATQIIPLIRDMVRCHYTFRSATHSGVVVLSSFFGIVRNKIILQ